MMLRQTILVALLLAGCGGRDDAPAPSAERELPVQPRNVLVIVLDTVRDDRIGVRGITPNLDAFTAGAIEFENAYSNSGWTLPAHASLFTGLYPVQHRATQETLAFGIDLPTLGELFGAAGWRTYGASANGVVSEANGLARGFERFDETFRQEVAARFGGTVHPNEGALVDFLDGAGDRPWFAFLNYIEAHLPYRPPAAFADRFVDTDRFSPQQIAMAQRVRMRDHYLTPEGIPQPLFDLLGQLYDAEVAALDAYIGHLLDTLRERGVLDETIVVITSDHGENLGEHGHFAHVFDLHNTLVEVPLIVRVPGAAPRGRSDAAQLLDLFPTLLALCGIDYAGEMHGRDLFAGGASTSDPIVVAEYYYPRQVLSVFRPEELETHADRFAPFLIRQRVAQTPTQKWWWRSDGRHTAFDLARDSEEGAGRDHEKAPRSHRELARLLDTFVETHQGPAPLIETPPAGWMMPGFEATIDDPELLERLRALGYVN
jgi:arylsulfatase A-like enzyme